MYGLFDNRTKSFVQRTFATARRAKRHAKIYRMRCYGVYHFKGKTFKDDVDQIFDSCALCFLDRKCINWME